MAVLRATAQTCDLEGPLLVLVPAITPKAIQTAQCWSAHAVALHCVGRGGERLWREQTQAAGDFHSNKESIKKALGRQLRGVIAKDPKAGASNMNVAGIEKISSPATKFLK